VEDKLFEKLDDLNIKDTKLLLEENIDLSIDTAVRKRIEKEVMKKTGYYEKQPKNKNIINNILGGIIMKKKIALALSAAVVLSLAGGGYAYAKTPVAYVSVDINPSVELGVNAFDTVVSVEAYNEDGSNILEGTDLLNVKVDEAVSTVVNNAINDGYIKEDGSSAIEITTSTDKTEVAAELDETLKDVVDETLTNNNLQAEVETENVALARRDEARKLGITPGKLNLIQKLQALDPAITVEEYKNSSVKDIQKKTKELRKNGIAETSTQDGTSTTTTSTDAATGTSDTATTSATESNTVAKSVVSTEANTTEEAIVEKGNKKASNDKENNGNNKKEEANINQETISAPTVEKQNKSENSNSQSSNNSLKEDKSGNVKSDSSNNNSSSSSKSDNSSKNNSSKSDNGGGSSANSNSSVNSSSNSQGKGKNK
jgi:hypothetical protein